MLSVSPTRKDPTGILLEFGCFLSRFPQNLDQFISFKFLEMRNMGFKGRSPFLECGTPVPLWYCRNLRYLLTYKKDDSHYLLNDLFQKQSIPIIAEE